MTILIISGVVGLVPAVLLFRFFRVLRRAGQPARAAEALTAVWAIFTITRVAVSLTCPGFPAWLWPLISVPLVAGSLILFYRAYQRVSALRQKARELADSSPPAA
jgi:hypothetical protein